MIKLHIHHTTALTVSENMIIHTAAGFIHFTQ